MTEPGGPTTSANGKRRKGSAADKPRIVLAGMQPNVEVSELGRREGINPTQYYGWKKQSTFLARLVRWYNEERLHSALGYLPPVVVYRGNPEERKAERRQKLAQARHRRRKRNLGLEQGTFPFGPGEVVASP